MSLSRVRFPKTVSTAANLLAATCLKTFVAWYAAAALVLAVAPLPALTADAADLSERHRPPGAIVDCRARLNPKFKKAPRQSTRFVIVHTSECNLEETLKIVSEGKQDDGSWVSRGGHAHYVIAEDGTVYRILDEALKANHAGLSMWNGTVGLNRSSVGIELVGYHDSEITAVQYKVLRSMIRGMLRRYRLTDRDVLTHSQVAYARPSEWLPRNHRGRKYCAVNFDRSLAGLGPTWPYDPDVKSGRLAADPVLAAVYYGEPDSPLAHRFSKLMDRRTTAWQIAGRSYDSPDTLYRLPSGVIISGNRIAARVGWGAIPAGTIVYFD